MSPYHFFMKYAAWGYTPGKQTKLQGRIAGAQALAQVERTARDEGFYFEWSMDPDIDSSDFSDEEPAWELWQCAMYDAEGRIVNSLHGIDFGRDKAPWGEPYRRVVEAELAIDGLTNEPQGRAA